LSLDHWCKTSRRSNGKFQEFIFLSAFETILFAAISARNYKMFMRHDADPNLEAIIHFLKSKHKCHTALLYGSRARGGVGAVSDYDVMGICERGRKTRIAKKINGAYWDLFVYPEKVLKKLGTQSLSWRNAKVLFEKGQYGSGLVKRIEKLVAKPFKPDPRYEIDVTVAWAEKQLDRIGQGDVQGLYRRAELQTVAIEHYFQIRRMQYWGPKAGLQWLEKNDSNTFKLFARVYKSPADIKALKSLVDGVYYG
jgi:predicted nucleotidyltransferase